MTKKLKPIVFHTSLEEQRLYGQLHAIDMDEEERLHEMYRLNKKLYGDRYGKVSRLVEVYQALPGESVNGFYQRVNRNG